MISGEDQAVFYPGQQILEKKGQEGAFTGGKGPKKTG